MSVNYAKIKKYISAPRLEAYEIVCMNDTQRALKLYQTNIRLSQAFYPLLTIFEVIFRNAINEELTMKFSDQNWLINQKNSFMIDPSLTSPDRISGKPKNNHFMKISIEKIENRHPNKCTQGKIISSLELGFWVAFFDKHHFKILLGRPIKIFSKLPQGTNRDTIFEKLLRIKEFRNRVYHNEAIIFSRDHNNSPIFRLDDAHKVYNDIKDLMTWLGIDFIKWAQKINNVNYEVKRANLVFSMYPSKNYYYSRLLIKINHLKNKYLA